MHISFEKISHTHFRLVTEVYNHYIQHTTATYHIQELSEEDVVSHFELTTASAEAFIIRYNQEMAGFCLIRQYNKKQGYKYTFEITIYLKPNYEKKGIGTKAVEFLEDTAKRKKVHILVAGICAENKASIKLFEKSGYMKCGFFPEVGYKFDRFLDNVYYLKNLDEK